MALSAALSVSVCTCVCAWVYREPVKCSWKLQCLQLAAFVCCGLIELQRGWGEGRGRGTSNGPQFGCKWSLNFYSHCVYRGNCARNRSLPPFLSPSLPSAIANGGSVAVCFVVVAVVFRFVCFMFVSMFFISVSLFLFDPRSGDASGHWSWSMHSASCSSSWVWGVFSN